MRKRVGVAVIIVIFFACLAFAFRGRSADSSIVKVLLRVGARQVVLSSEKGFLLYRSSAIKNGQSYSVTTLKFSLIKNRICWENKKEPASFIFLRPQSGSFVFNGRRYRGDCLLFIKKNRLAVVNRLPIESYLKGVLPHEIDPRWSLETLKAQAVAARSFAYVKMRENINRYYDLDCTAFSQVYKGMSGENERTNYAVDETAGYVLYYKNKVAVGFFHASCGGVTENSANVWRIALPYLQVKKSPYCKGTKYSRWYVVLSQKRLRSALSVTGTIISARVKARFPSGRVRSLVLKNRKGRSFWFSGRRFRALLGYNRMRSLLFYVQIRGPYLQIIGKGWGHGVGMCQWCAAKMGAHGISAMKILRHFYSGVQIKQYRVTLAWK